MPATDVMRMAGNVYAAARTLKNLGTRINIGELTAPLADLESSVAALAIRIAELIEENTDLAQRLAWRDGWDSVAKELVLRDRFYFFGEAPEGSSPGPYCPNCADVHHRLTRLLYAFDSQKASHRYACSRCGSAF
ncbi:MAG TPA: hypothetical protein VNZ54_04245 [bacterium]|jgi:hypothetical protein|nr:hypothetical protein [bacterium]